MLRFLCFLIATGFAMGPAVAGPTDEQFARLAKVVEAERDIDKRKAASTALAMLLARYGREQQALAIAETLPRNGDHIVDLAHSFIKGGSYAAAIRIIEPAGGESVFLFRLHIAEHQLLRGKSKDSAATAASAAREREKLEFGGAVLSEADALVRLGALQRKLGLDADLASTLGRLQTIVDAERRNSRKPGASPSQLRAFEFRLGELLLAAGRPQEGAAVLDALIASVEKKDLSDRILATSYIASIMQVYGLAQAVEVAERAEGLLARRQSEEAVFDFGILKLAELQALRGRTDAAVASLKLVDGTHLVQYLAEILGSMILDGRISEAGALLDRFDELIAGDLPPAPVGAPVVSRHADAKQWSLSVMATIDLMGTGARARGLIEQAAALARQVRIADAKIAWWARVALLADAPGGDAAEFGGVIREAWAALVDTIEHTTDCCTPYASDRLVELQKHIGRFGVIANPL